MKGEILQAEALSKVWAARPPRPLSHRVCHYGCSTGPSWPWWAMCVRAVVHVTGVCVVSRDWLTQSVLLSRLQGCDLLREFAEWLDVREACSDDVDATAGTLGGLGVAVRGCAAGTSCLLV